MLLPSAELVVEQREAQWDHFWGGYQVLPPLCVSPQSLETPQREDELLSVVSAAP